MATGSDGTRKFEESVGNIPINRDDGYKTLSGIGGGMQVWDDDTLRRKLVEVEEIGMQVGKSFIYPLWKSLLNKWFGFTDSKVYIVTPFIDKGRLEDVCRIALAEDSKGTLECFYVRNKCNHYNSIDLMRERVNKSMNLTGEDQKKLDKVLKMAVDPGKYFHARFFGCVRGEEAEVMVPSTHCANSHFGYDGIETVYYTKMSKVMFEKRFLQHIIVKI